MAPNEYLYWDASVFSSYIGAIPDRVEIIDALLDEVRNSRSKRILTSVISIMEVAFATGHGPAQPVTSEQAATIDELWNCDHIVLVEASQVLMYRARDLMRTAVDQSSHLKPNDALHLATASWANQNIGRVIEIHTYDKKWHGLSHLVNGLSIRMPWSSQPKLPMSDI